MERLADDELCQILSRVTDPDDRKSVSQVCKGWRVMEGLSRSSLRVLNLIHLPRLLARYPNLTTFQTHKPVSNVDLALVAKSCPKLEAFILDATSCFEEVREIGVQDIDAFTQLYIDRGGDEIVDETGISVDEVLKRLRELDGVGNEGLCALADGCPKLSKIVLRRSGAGQLGLKSMITSAAHNLTHLDLGVSSDLDQALEAIGSCSCSLGVLNLRGCSITDAGLRFLVNGSCSKTIKKLNLCCCFEITDAGVFLLCKMSVLEELDLGFCTKVTDVGGQAISTIRTLRVLNLACLPLLTEKTFVALAEKCINLEVLNFQQNGRRDVTSASIDTFLGHKCLRILNLKGRLSHDFRLSTLESLALRCPSLESIVVETRFRERLLQELEESILSRFLQFA